MDLSKLKPMSQTPATPPPPNEASNEINKPAPPMALDYSNKPLPQEFGLVSIWISLIMGVICIYLGKQFGAWAAYTLSGQEFHTTMFWDLGLPTQKEVPYWQLANYTAHTEAGLFSLGIVLLIDAGLTVLARQGFMSLRMIQISLVLMMLTLLLNAGVAVMVFRMNVLPLYSLMAMLVGGIVFFTHLDSLKYLKEARLVRERMGVADGAK